jgi:hypothetical protein
MKRRNFLKFSALVAGLGAAGAGPGLAATEAPPLPSLDAMRRIGRIHLAARPDEISEAQALRTRIEAAGGFERPVLRRLLSDDMRRDLGEANVAVVDGWVLPRALVRICCAASVA